MVGFRRSCYQGCYEIFGVATSEHISVDENHLSGSALIGTYAAIKSTASIAKSRCSLRGQDGLIGIDHSF